MEEATAIFTRKGDNLESILTLQGRGNHRIERRHRIGGRNRATVERQQCHAAHVFWNRGLAG